jgi:hypothetical protein
VRRQRAAHRRHSVPEHHRHAFCVRAVSWRCSGGSRPGGGAHRLEMAGPPDALPHVRGGTRYSDRRRRDNNLLSGRIAPSVQSRKRAVTGLGIGAHDDVKQGSSYSSGATGAIGLARTRSAMSGRIESPLLPRASWRCSRRCGRDRPGLPRVPKTNDTS